MIPFLIWLENTDFFTFMRGSAYAYPVILALHLVFISAFGAMILVTDIRLLGWGMRSQRLSDIVNQLRWPKRIGFVLVAACGITLFGSKAEEYYHNVFFDIKVLLFTLVAIHALVFRSRVYNHAEAFDEAKEIPGQVKLAAALSLVLWVAIPCAGRAIGYIPAPAGFHYRASLRAPGASIAAVHAVEYSGEKEGEPQVFTRK
jgi:hypothetical protein